MGVLASAIAYVFWPVEVNFEDSQAVVEFKPLEGGTQGAVVTRSPLNTTRWNKFFVYDLNPDPIEATVDVLNPLGKKCTVNYRASWSIDPENLASLHKKVGPDYRETLVKHTIDHMIRARSAEVQIPDYSFEPNDFGEHYLNAMTVSVLNVGCT